MNNFQSVQVLVFTILFISVRVSVLMRIVLIGVLIGLILFQAWRDEFLTWNASDFNNVTEILVSRGEVWTPDILVENT